MSLRVRRGPTTLEFTALLALSMALVALGTDIMLPALGAIRAELGLAPDATSVAMLVTAYFVGLAVGQLAYGPLSDRFGRRRALFVGYGIYIAGALASAAAPSLALLVASRFVWGLGAAGPRVVTVAVIRDTYEGERMSRAMSFVMAIFVLVPIIAPLLGAAIVAVASWRWVFGACVVGAVIMTVWALLRLPETLANEHQLELRMRRVATAARVVVSDRQALGYGLAMTVLYGSFMSYLASSEIIIGDAFGRPDLFPAIFATLAAVMGCAMLVNARIVGRVGTRRLGHAMLLIYLGVAGVFLTISIATDGRPQLWVFVACIAPLLASHALLIPNLNTIAMVNMAPVAGTASSIIGATQIALGAALGAMIDQAFAGTVLPLSTGFVTLGVVALGLVLWVERGRLFRPLLPPSEPDPFPTVPES
jgi:MFS transporter, DHA1 family, multidrug resistance protein